MKMCRPHWDQLRAAVESRGLGHLIAANGREAHARAVAELKGEADPVADFDPLMVAHNMILSHATEGLGLFLFTGDYCPVCELLKVYPPIPEGHRYKTNQSYMIDGPADAVLEMAREAGVAIPLRASDAEGGES